MNPARYNSSKVLELFPMIAGTALFLNHTRGNVPIAATNGTDVIFGDGFFKFSDPEKNGVVLHEYLHCALSHPERGGVLRNKIGEEYCPIGFNIAADAIINHTIEIESAKRSNITLPEGCIEFRKIKKCLTDLDIDGADHITTSSISVEELYFYIMKAKNQEKPSKENKGQGSSKSIDLDAADTAWQEIQDMFEDEPDLKAASGSTEDLQDKIRENTAKLDHAKYQAGSDTGSLIERISGDIPKTKIRWETSFRNITAKHLSRDRHKNPRKPSNGMLSYDSMGRSRIWEQGRSRRPIPRCLVLADTSGSIFMEIYMKFLGELDGMRRRTNAHLFFAQADTEVKNIRQIKNTNEIRTLHIEGRAGTDFIKPLKYAEEGNYDLVIYMTDLEGTFPSKCDVPVIWVSPKTKTNITPPFGRHFKV